MITVKMSSVCMKLLTIACLCSMALSSKDQNGVVWRQRGEPITIQCRFVEAAAENLAVVKGLNQEFQVFHRDKKSKMTTIHDEFGSRLQVYGEFPSVDILIKNLSTVDTGPYWCTYEVFDTKLKKGVFVKGTGSVLLVVTESKETKVTKPCADHTKTLVLVSVVIIALVLLTMIVPVSIWVYKAKARRRTEKPRRVASNEVYEDMRGTIRR